MKIDYLADGSPDCPILRLYDFETSEAKKLYAAIAEIVEKKTNSVALIDLPFVESSQGCTLTFEVSTFDEGVVHIRNLEFKCLLTHAGWNQVHNLVEPFLVDINGFQWLDETSHISLLFTPDEHGRW